MHGDAALARLRLCQPDRAHLRVGEGDARHRLGAGAVAGVLPENLVGRDPSLVLAHVRERRQPVAVADREQPGSVHAGHPQGVVDVDGAGGLHPHAVEAEQLSLDPATGRDQQLVGVVRGAALDVHGGRPAVRAAHLGYLGSDDHVDALILEGAADLVAGERLLAGQQPWACLDHGDLLAAEPPEGLG